MISCHLLQGHAAGSLPSFFHDLKRSWLSTSIPTFRQSNVVRADSPFHSPFNSGLIDPLFSRVTSLSSSSIGRGLDIHPYSFGLDSGCVYGRQLTALILGDLGGLDKYESVTVGDRVGKLVSIECPS